MRELLNAAKRVLAQFEFIKAVQYNVLVKGQTLESASENWKTLGNEYIDFQPLMDAVARVEAAASPDAALRARAEAWLADNAKRGFLNTRRESEASAIIRALLGPDAPRGDV